MFKEKLKIQNQSQTETLNSCPAFSVPSSCPAQPTHPYPDFLALIIPESIAPYFCTKKYDAWKVKHLRLKMFTAILTARRELLADPDSDSRRAL